MLSSQIDYPSLANIRFLIRRFLHFSEEAARKEGLEPQQHQLLLTIRADESSHGPTVGEIAEHLFIRHHSAVGLIDRLAEHGFVRRVREDDDRRQVRVRLTASGAEKLDRLSEAHRAELLSSGPSLVEALGRLLASAARSEHVEENDVSPVENRNS